MSVTAVKPRIRELTSLARDGVPAADRVPAARPSPRLLVRLDVAMLAMAALATQLLPRTHGVGAWSLLFAAGVILDLARRDLYRERVRTSAIDGLGEVAGAIARLTVAFVALRTVAGSAADPIGDTILPAVLAAGLLCAGRLGHNCAVRRRRRRGDCSMRTLIVGADQVGLALARRLQARPDAGLRPIGFLEAPGAMSLPAPGGGLPRLGSLEDFEDVVARHRVESVVIAFPAGDQRRLTDLLGRCRTLGIDASFVPRLLEEVGAQLEVDHIGGLPLIRSGRPDPGPWSLRAKYFVDRVIAGLLLLALAPVLVLIAIAVRATSSGPMLFQQPRMGARGREFQILKFRTMDGIGGADDANACWAASVCGVATAGAPARDRRTRLGGFLRRWSLDELPQLVNVLRGEMSLIGPRPERVEYLQSFRDHIDRYDERHRVRPGVTGWAQVQGLRGETSLEDRVEWDNHYIQNWSWRLDVKIILLTLPAVIQSRRLA